MTKRKKLGPSLKDDRNMFLIFLSGLRISAQVRAFLKVFLSREAYLKSELTGSS